MAGKTKKQSRPRENSDQRQRHRAQIIFAVLSLFIILAMVASILATF